MKRIFLKPDHEKSTKLIKRSLVMIRLKGGLVELGLSIRKVNRLVKAYREGRKAAFILHRDHRKNDK